MFDVKECSFFSLFYFGVVWDRRINVSFAPLCLPKWRSPCNQNSLNALWMLGTDFCAWVQTWLGLSVGALVLGSPSLAGETCQLQIVFAMLLLSHFSCVWLCEIPEMAAHQAPLSLGFSREEHWSGLSCPSPMHESEKLEQHYLQIERYGSKLSDHEQVNGQRRC